MEKFNNPEEAKKEVTEVKTFPVPVALGVIKESSNVTVNATPQPSKEILINKAFDFHAKGNISEASKYYQLFINRGFKDHRIFSNYGIILKNIGKLKEAEICQRKSIELNPSCAESYYNLGVILSELGNFQEAEISILKAVEIKPNFSKAYSNLGLIQIDLGNLQEAEVSIRKALELNPNHANAHSNLGHILIELGNLKEAEKSIRKAIELNPNHANAHSYLGLLYIELGNLKEAEVSTRKAIELKPDFAVGYLNLGNILKDLGKLKEAEISLQKAIELNPDLAKAYEVLGLILLTKSDFDLSLECFSKSAQLLNESKNKESDRKRFNLISKAKIEHDIEQFEYLASKGYETKKFNDLAILYKKVSSEINWPSKTQLTYLNKEYQCLLKDSYNRLLHQIITPKLQHGVVNDSLNFEKISDNYFNHEYGLTYIDNLLNSKALESLRKFLLESTIWYNVKQNGYIGAFLREGFANPLIIQIADELRKKFPKIFKDYPINHIWAFKYDNRAKNKNSPHKGINIHADFAAINVNFWITPNEANLNPKSGGLIVYDVEAPKDWDFKTYNKDQKKIREELKKSKGNTKVIPYKENRAVVFNSNLFHETDTYEFKEGYENRRINVTILFGKRNQ